MLRLDEYEAELKKVRDTIDQYNTQITDNEQKIEELQKELDKKTGKTPDRPDSLPPGVFQAGIPEKHHRAL